MVYLSVKGVRALSKERPWWGGGLLPGTTQSRPAPLYAGRWLTILHRTILLAGARVQQSYGLAILEEPKYFF